jgi:D-beta-D-heptose 7-phosphate kinase/D-beta-D-heptose 1-phosphate adenosyltransferase
MQQKQKKILVVGDLILDVYHHGRYLGQSLANPETPVAHRHASTYAWGGAGFVVRNLLALGGSVTFITSVGVDDFTKKANEFTHRKLKKIFLPISKKPTTVKQRFWIGDRQLLGWHQYDNSPLSTSLEKELLALVRSELPAAGKVVIADYRHGLLSASLAKKIIALCAQASVPLYVDSQVSYSSSTNHVWYTGADLFCLNQKEAKSIDSSFDARKPLPSLKRLQQLLGASAVVVKLGADGSIALLGDEYIKTNAHVIQEIDATGAGDAFLAALALGVHPPRPQDLAEANIWAALSTTTVGTTIPSVKKFTRAARRTPAKKLTKKK